MIIIENENQDGQMGLLIEHAPEGAVKLVSESIKEAEEVKLEEADFNMLKKYKNILLNESNHSMILESNKPQYHIKGLYSEADVELRNPRIYTKTLLERERLSFTDNQIARNKGWGEAEHPTSRSHIIIDRLSHRTIGLDWDGNKLIGDSTLIEGHPYGDMCIAIGNNGGQLSVSSRALGSVVRKYVQENLRLICWDIVLFPSADSALEMMKEQEDLLLKNGITCEAIDDAKKQLKLNSNNTNFESTIVELFNKLLSNTISDISESDLVKFKEYKYVNTIWLQEKFKKSDSSDFNNFCFEQFSQYL